MGENGQLDAFMIFEALKNTRVLRTDISFDDILNEFDFLDSVL